MMMQTLMYNLKIVTPFGIGLIQDEESSLHDWAGISDEAVEGEVVCNVPTIISC